MSEPNVCDTEKNVRQLDNPVQSRLKKIKNQRFFNTEINGRENTSINTQKV